MRRIAETFARLAGETALIPYITAGDPDSATTLSLMHGMADNGADIIELGIPFSDPMADGSSIQKAAERALSRNTTPRDVLATVARFREHNRHTPVVLMGYLNPIHRIGYQNFAGLAQAAGVDGVLTVDNPIETAAPLHHALDACGIDTVLLVAPTSTEERIAAIAAQAQGFIYCVSLKGVTGAATLDTAQAAATAARIRRHSTLPVAVGFGISEPADAQALARSADAVIIGSRIVKEIEANPGRETEAVGQLIRTFKQALRQTQGQTP